jgi:para-nitrobenzyl esterase
MQHGESAGAAYVCDNVTSPTAVGLFRAAIAESGCGQPSTPVAQAESFGFAVAAKAGCMTSSAVDLACLQSQTPDALNAIAAEYPVSCQKMPSARSTIAVSGDSSFR